MKYYCSICKDGCVVESEKAPFICPKNAGNYCHFTKNKMEYVSTVLESQNKKE